MTSNQGCFIPRIFKLPVYSNTTRAKFHMHAMQFTSLQMYLSVIISMNAFPIADTLHPRGNTTRWATFRRARCQYRCNTHAHDLEFELVKTVEMLRDDKPNSVIPQTRFRVHGNTFFLSRKHASGNAYMESGPYSSKIFVTKTSPSIVQISVQANVSAILLVFWSTC